MWRDALAIHSQTPNRCAHPRYCREQSSSIVGYLSLNGQQEWLLESFRNPAQETRGVGAIDQPVIVRERERQNQARLKFVVDPFWLHPRTRQAENGNFRMIHDRRKSCTADSAEIRDRERDARH